METPEWLNSGFLSASLEGDEGSVEILEYVVQPAVPEGYNWFSSLYRVKLKFTNTANVEKTTSLIVKVPSNNELIKQFTIDLRFFEHEFQIYNEVLPKIYSSLDDETLSPRKLFSLKDDVLVLEDLNPSGYFVADRMSQLDYDHTLYYLRQLAKLHAGTVALYETNPDYIETIGKELMFTKANKNYVHGKYYVNCLDLTVEALKSLGHENYCQKIRNVKDTIWDTVVRVLSTEKHIRVLNHGDASLINALFKHKVGGGTVTDMKLVDYQLIRYASPAIDIHYLFMTSVKPEVLWKSFDELIDAYREMFNLTAEKMKAKTRMYAQQLEEELKFAGSFAFLIACSLMPMIIADPEKPAKISSDGESAVSVDASVNPFVKIYENERFKRIFVELMAFLEKRGYF